jgi:hypothetical protein
MQKFQPKSCEIVCCCHGFAVKWYKKYIYTWSQILGNL